MEEGPLPTQPPWPRCGLSGVLSRGASEDSVRKAWGGCERCQGQQWRPFPRTTWYWFLLQQSQHITGPQSLAAETSLGEVWV